MFFCHKKIRAIGKKSLVIVVCGLEKNDGGRVGDR